jgi:hypothetical protein
MAKFTDANQLIPTVGATQPSAIEGWLKQANDTMNNFKGLLELAGKYKTAQAQLPKVNEEAQPGAKHTSEIATFVKILIDFGFGDTPIGELLSKVSPLTLNQVVGVLQNATRPKQ